MGNCWSDGLRHSRGRTCMCRRAQGKATGHDGTSWCIRKVEILRIPAALMVNINGCSRGKAMALGVTLDELGLLARTFSSGSKTSSLTFRAYFPISASPKHRKNQSTASSLACSQNSQDLLVHPQHRKNVQYT